MVSSHQPMIDSRVKIGPMEERAGRRYFLVKHSATARVFRIGEKERFLLESMDGRSDLESIGRLYEGKFGARMTATAWQQFFSLAGQRSLLTFGGFPGVEAPARSPGRFQMSRTGVFAWNIKLVNPQFLLARAEATVRCLFSPAAVIAGLLLIVLSEAWVAQHFHVIYSQMVSVRFAHWRIVGFVIPVILASACIHELSHALTCQHFGGSVTDMGIVFRYLTFYPYTRLDDVMFFHRRLHRVYVFAAGTYSSLVLSVPFIALWLAVSGPELKAACGIVIFFLSLGALANLVPFVQLDGYWILSSMLRMPDLRQDSYLFWKSVARAVARRKERIPYTRRETVICVIYGTVSAAVSLAVTVAAAFHWHSSLARLAGSGYAWVLVFLLTGMLAALRIKGSATAARRAVGARVTKD